MNKLKVIFMGTPEFSVPVLGALITETDVIMVVTRPDSLVGRKKVLTQCPVKKLALENNIHVISPYLIKDAEKEIINTNADIIITCAYGQIISENLLEFPKYGCINVHASLLPKYRGGAPIHHALINGEKETGITIMYMDEGMDSGDIINKQSISITDKDNIETLSNKLSILGSKSIIKQLPLIISGKNNRDSQNINEVSYAPIIKRTDEALDFCKTSKQVHNLFRAMSPSPLPYFTIDNLEYKVVECSIVNATGKPKTIVSVNKEGIAIMASDNGINITKIKPIGKKTMEVKDFLNGNDFKKYINMEVD